MAPSITVPQALLKNVSNKSRFLREVLSRAIDNRLKPVELQGTASIHTQVVLTNELKTRLSVIQKDYPDLSLYQLVSRLIAAQYFYDLENEKGSQQSHRKKTENEWLSLANDLLTGFGHNRQIPRKKQKKVLAQLLQTYQKSSSDKEPVTVLAEAGTGIGKSRILVALAHYLSGKTDKPVVLCAPTKNLIRQLVSEYTQVYSEQEQRPISVVFGRSDYISEVALKDWYFENKEKPEAQRAYVWLDEQQTQHSDLLPGYLFESLIEAVPELSNNHSLILTNDDDPLKDLGAQTYYHHLKAKEAKIIFASHAMVCIDILRRRKTTRSGALDWEAYENLRKECYKKNKRPKPKQLYDNSEQVKLEHSMESANDTTGILPAYDHLLLDEAHLIKNSFESVLSDSVSLSRLLSNIKRLSGQNKLKRFLDRLEVVTRDFQNIGIHHNEMAVSVKNNPDHIQSVINDGLIELKEICNSISKHLEGIKDPNEQEMAVLREVNNALLFLKKTTSGNSLMNRTLKFSAVQRKPSLSVQANDVTPLLDYLWKRSQLNVLLSATLFVFYNKVYCSVYIGKKLGIGTKIDTLTPVENEWIYSPVTVYLPKKKEMRKVKNKDNTMDTRYYLEPPTVSRYSAQTVRKLNTEWLDELAEKITSITRDSKGGSLIMCTSYEDVNGLAEVLQNSVLEERLISTGASKQYFVHQQLFQSMYQEQKNPVWICAGRVWTGLDLVAKGAARDDHLLENLIIPKIPIAPRAEQGGSRSSRETSYETFFMFRQGIGRLVRRNGVPPKNLFILDGRINQDRIRSIIKPILNLLKKYPKQKGC